MKKGKQGGVLSNGKGMNFPFISLSFSLIITPLYSKMVIYQRIIVELKRLVIVSNWLNIVFSSIQEINEMESYHLGGKEKEE